MSSVPCFIALSDIFYRSRQASSQTEMCFMRSSVANHTGWLLIYKVVICMKVNLEKLVPLSFGNILVCVWYIFRIFGAHECLYSSAKLSASLLYSNVQNIWESGGELNINIDYVCRICSGILQFLYYDQQSLLVKSGSARDVTLMIADAVKKD